MHTQIHLVGMNFDYNHDCWSKKCIIPHSLTNAYSVLNGGASNRKTYTNFNYLLKAWVSKFEGGEICWRACLKYRSMYLFGMNVVDGEMLATVYDCNVRMVVQLQVMWYLPLLLNRTEDNLPVRERWWLSPVKWMDHYLFSGMAHSSVRIQLSSQLILQLQWLFQDLLSLLLLPVLLGVVAILISYPPFK